MRASKGKAKGKAKLTSRVFRSPAARVTVELRKGDGLAAILAALLDAVASIEVETGGES